MPHEETKKPEQAGAGAGQGMGKYARRETEDCQGVKGRAREQEGAVADEYEEAVAAEHEDVPEHEKAGPNAHDGAGPIEHDGAVADKHEDKAEHKGAGPNAHDGAIADKHEDEAEHDGAGPNDHEEARPRDFERAAEGEKEQERRIRRNAAERRMKAELASHLAALFVAPLLASIGISLFLLEPAALIYVLLFSWIGTLCVAMPVSWMIGRIVGKKDGSGRALLSVLLHGAAGGALMLAFNALAEPGSLAPGGFGWLFVLSGAANGFAYGLIRLAVRSLVIGREPFQK
ncbi:hypothetical protein ACTHPH_14100 [Paenibacillus pasadenensis]|nr:hypothetical protein [Paenibacillus pasadenensis]